MPRDPVRVRIPDLPLAPRDPKLRRAPRRAGRAGGWWCARCGSASCAGAGGGSGTRPWTGPSCSRQLDAWRAEIVLDVLRHHVDLGETDRDHRLDDLIDPHAAEGEAGRLQPHPDAVDLRVHLRNLGEAGGLRSSRKHWERRRWRPKQSHLAERPLGAAPDAASGRGGPGASKRFGRGQDPAAREALRKWRLDVSLDRYREVAKKFTDAGLTFYSYNLSFNDSYTDEEIEKGLEMTKALGTKIITASSPLTVLPRVAPLAEKHNVIVALHNHTTGPEEFAQAMARSKNMWVNLDIGHFFASGHDPLAYLREHHARITNVHVKDRQKNQGREMPFGQGDTPLKEALLLIRRV